MFLFLHGTGATSSLWLKQIRGIFLLDQKFSDKEILDIFTISLPGHPKNDANFDIPDIIKLIDKEIEEKRQKQLELAEKLIISQSGKLVGQLKNEKIVLIGHSIGSLFAIHYAMRYPASVSKLILISFGYQFNLPVVKLTDWFYRNIVLKFNTRQLGVISKLTINIRLKTIIDICSQNSERKGLFSCRDIILNYRLDKSFGLLSLDDQLKFSQIPILAIGGGFDFLVRPSSYKDMKKYLKKSSKYLVSKKTVLDNSEPKNLFNYKYNIYRFSGHEPMDSNINRFIKESREFLMS